MRKLKLISLWIFIFPVKILYVQNAAIKDIRIGSQTWMAENLNTAFFNNGDPIPHAKTDEEWKKAGENKQPAWCYYQENSKDLMTVGRLYNWYAVSDKRGLAPKGWRIPRYIDFVELFKALGGENIASEKMKSLEGWESTPNDNTEKVFNAKPGGCILNYGAYSQSKFIGTWWTQTEDCSSLAWGVHLDAESLMINDNKGNGFYVRCIKEDYPSVHAQIQNIKKVKNDIDKLILKTAEINCESKKKLIRKISLENTYPYDFVQTYKKCAVTNNYTVIEGVVNDWEYYVESKYYYLDKKLIFAFYTWSTVMEGPEYKIYFNDKEEIIRVLETSENFDTGVKTLDVELKDKIEINKVKGYLENNLNTLKEYFGQ